MKAIKAKVEKFQYTGTQESIIANLADKKNHIELMMAKMKMQSTVHDYIEYGLSLGDIYLTLVAQ